MVALVLRFFPVIVITYILTGCGRNPFLFKDDYNEFTGELKSFHHVGSVRMTQDGSVVTIKEVANTKTDQRSYFLLLITGYNYKNEPNVNFSASKPLYLLVDNKKIELPVLQDSVSTYSVTDPSVEIIHGYEVVPGVMSNSQVEFKKGMAIAAAEYKVSLDTLNRLRNAKSLSMMYYLTDSSSGIIGSFTAKHFENLQSFKPMNVRVKLESLNKPKKK